MLYEAGIHGSSHQPTAAGYFWNSADPELSVEYMVLQLAFNNAVVVAMTFSPAFVAPSNGFVTYDPADLAKTPLGGHAVHVVSFVSNQDLQAVMPNAPPALVAVTSSSRIAGVHASQTEVIFTFHGTT